MNQNEILQKIKSLAAAQGAISVIKGGDVK